MSHLLIRERGRTWDPLRLGRSLPITRGMRRSRLVGLLIAVTGLAAVVYVGKAVIFPSVPELSQAAARTLVVETLDDLAGSSGDGRSGLPVWDPSGDLSTEDRPGFLLVRDAGLHEDLTDPERDATLVESHEFLRQGQYQKALALYAEVSRNQPGSWTAWYHAGLTRARQQKWPEARELFAKAHQVMEQGSTRTPDDLARRIATRYSLGLSTLREESRCEDGIHRLKESLNALKEYIPVAVKARLVFASDINDLFSLHNFDLDSYQIRNALIEGYLQCARYPEVYFEERPWAETFQESEYDDPDHPEIRDGLFPRQLTACVAEEVPGRRCWALSNLNQLYYSSRNYLPAAGGSWSPDPEIEGSYDSLVQMAYNVAVLLAEDADAGEPSAAAPPPPDRTPAAFLEKAATVNEHAGDEDLQRRIEQFARHLAFRSEDFRVLALRYRQTPTAELRFTAGNTADELRGMAGALRRRFESYLRDHEPERIAQDLDLVRGHLTERAHLESLAAWRRQIEEQMQDALATAMGLEDRRDETSKALAIRGYRAGFLGDGWPWEAFRTWMTPGRTAVLLAAVLLYGLLVALWLLIHRLVVYPYLTYTAHFYESEFERRHRECQDGSKPFTGEEIRERETRRSDAFRNPAT